MVNWHNSRLPKLEGESEITTVYEMVINRTQEMGFKYCSFTMSTQSENTQAKPFNCNNYPNEWNKIYQQAGFFDKDPAVVHCKHSVLPILWEKQAFGNAPELWDLAESFGVHMGWSQAVHDFKGVFSMLTLVRDKGEVSPEELYEKAGQVLWLCHAMHAVVALQYTGEPIDEAPFKLTARETEILRWCAMGKTAAEIARILCLSERTVGFHIGRVLSKLKVTSKIQAVLCLAKAGML
ncbi:MULTISPECIES: LuxR family transcriptional regulator [Pseudomonas]|uniref:helix-turn-helix transcriptional regulator n=1 Tax=Pseudomonas TaxID=286 RepID=UPI001C0A825A|nr:MULTISPECIES: LuxR family transcriptional regulator [Pseudomonas]MCK3836657.1 LuxR family transcriptional regulator [Pseudomonas sp. NCIMB 10586]VCU65036.1 LuxR family transcriptional regulator [Pseudomonas synxantha]